MVYTLDLVLEARDVGAKLRFNPRRDLFANVASVEAVDPLTVVIRLKRPQPSLLMILASGFTPVGLEARGDRGVREEPDYFVKGRPYLDGLRSTIIRDRGTSTAALQTQRVDVTFPGDTTKPMAEQLKKSTPQIVTTQVGTSVVDHLLFNAGKPPFDNPRLREAVSRAIDRRAYIEAVYQGGATLGGPMASKPYGVWSLPEQDIVTMPGYGKPTEEQARARALLAASGASALKPSS